MMTQPQRRLQTLLAQLQHTAGLEPTPTAGAAEEEVPLHHRGFAVGLVNSTSDAHFYARRLDPVNDVKHFTKTGRLWRAAEQDANKKGQSTEDYLKTIEVASQKFCRDSGVYDREDLLGVLRRAMAGEGQLLMLLGGKSVGKSLVLRALVQEYNSKSCGPFVVRVDARMEGSDLAAGIMDCIEETNQQNEGRFKPWLDEIRRMVWQGVRHIGETAVNRATGVPGLGEAMMKETAASNDTNGNAATKKALRTIRGFTEVAHKEGRMPCLFIDEAQVALRAEENGHTREVFDLLTALTKQERRLNVLMATSEHSYPFRLRQVVGFKLADLKNVIFAGEVPPQSMRALLVDQWGLGPELSEMLLACYGGHVLTTSDAIAKLAMKQELFAAEDAMASDLYTQIVECIEQEAEQKGIVDIMRKLAVDGFAPLQKLYDPRAEVLSKHDVAGVVPKTGVAAGLPPEVWAGTESGIVPASQSVRLMLLKKLAAQGLLGNKASAGN